MVNFLDLIWKLTKSHELDTYIYFIKTNIIFAKLSFVDSTQFY